MTDTPQNIHREPPPRRMRLPFEKREVDPGTWSYDHRAGICITLIAYLLLGIGLMWWKLDFSRDTANETFIYIELPEDFFDEPEPLEQPEELVAEDYANLRNAASNENAEEDLNSQLRDDRGTNASNLYENAGAVSDRMSENRKAYEEGLAKLDEEFSDQGGNEEFSGERHDSKIQGNVTVSYSFSDPVRYDIILDVPAYRCRGGGVVVVNATLDINGNVTAVSVDKSRSVQDDCMQSSAISAARKSRFNLDSTAPAKHRGTITYKFTPQ